MSHELKGSFFFGYLVDQEIVGRTMPYVSGRVTTGMFGEGSITVEIPDTQYKTYGGNLLDFTQLFAQGAGVPEALREGAWRLFLGYVEDNSRVIEVGPVVSATKDMDKRTTTVQAEGLASLLRRRSTNEITTANLGKDILETHVGSGVYGPIPAHLTALDNRSALGGGSLNIGTVGNSGATGSLTYEYKPRDFVNALDPINWTADRRGWSYWSVYPTLLMDNGGSTTELGMARSFKWNIRSQPNAWDPATNVAKTIRINPKDREPAATDVQITWDGRRVTNLYYAFGERLGGGEPVYGYSIATGGSRPLIEGSGQFMDATQDEVGAIALNHIQKDPTIIVDMKLPRHGVVPATTGQVGTHLKVEFNAGLQSGTQTFELICTKVTIDPMEDYYTVQYMQEWTD